MEFLRGLIIPLKNNTQKTLFSKILTNLLITIDNDIFKVTQLTLVYVDTKYYEYLIQTKFDAARIPLC